MRLRTYTVPMATVLFIDLKACSAMAEHHVCERVAAFYEQVDALSAEHGVSKAEVRGDCCICIAGAEGAVACPALLGPAADPAADQATRVLRFAAALHAELARLTHLAGAEDGGLAAATRMGIATGEVAFLVGGDAGPAPGGAAAFASAQGDTVNLAARMQALAEPGAAMVHKSAAERWAAEGPRGRAPPPTVCVEVKGRGLQRAAVFDCAAAAFRPAAPAPVPAPAAGAAGPLAARLAGPGLLFGHRFAAGAAGGGPGGPIPRISSAP
jgi:class 3 adenylate cyclase